MIGATGQYTGLLSYGDGVRLQILTVQYDILSLILTGVTNVSIADNA